MYVHIKMLKLIIFIFFSTVFVVTSTNAHAQWTFDPAESEVLTATSPSGQNVTVVLPRTAIQPSEIAVLVNTADPQSVEVGAYYQQKRNIPVENMIYLNFTPANSINNIAFDSLKTQVDEAVFSLIPEIQAYAITWRRPWKVNKLGTGRSMSITSAFALGYDEKYFNTTAIAFMGTEVSEYFFRSSTRPYTDFGIRPTMSLAGMDAQSVFDLIDTSVLADKSFPVGDGYFIRTTDSARSKPRFQSFVDTVNQFDRRALAMNYIDNSQGGNPLGNYLENIDNVLFYFTGLSRVPQFATNTYLPGAVADHLTSAAGCLDSPENCGQMSALRWLESGVSASYGTVQEPCASQSKFPDVEIFIPNYFRGQTVLEAYWKSVSSPGEGVFVRDPLTRPYGTNVTLNDAGDMNILTTALRPGKVYSLLEGDTVDGPFEIVQSNISVDNFQFVDLNQKANKAVYVLFEERNFSFPQQIMSNPKFQIYPKISGNRVVWMDTRNGIEGNIYFDIYYCELDENTQACLDEVRVTQNNNDHINPLISGDKIVWMELPANPMDSSFGGIAGVHILSPSNIFLYDMGTNITTQITDNVIIRRDLQVEGNYIVWIADEDNDSDDELVIYNTDNGVKQLVENEFGLGSFINNVSLSGNYIVYEDVDSKQYVVYLYDIAAATKQPIGNFEKYADFSDGKILFERSGFFYLYDINTALEEEIGQSFTYTTLKMLGDIIV